MDGIMRKVGLVVGLAVVLFGATVLTGCKQPQIAEEKWGWGVNGETDKTRYEYSLDHEFEDNPKARWRVLNYVMDFVATGLAEKDGPSSRRRELLDGLQDYGVVGDSAKVMEVYSSVFIDEKISGAGEANDFIVELIARTQQVLEWGGFDAFGLNPWGKVLVLAGPFKDFRRDFHSVKGISTVDGLTYVATEGSDYRLSEIEVIPGPLDKFEKPGDYDDPEGLAGPQNLGAAEKAKSGVLSMIGQSALQRIIHGEVLGIRDVKILRFPSPSNKTIDTIGASHCTREWDSNKLLVDLYANIEAFVSSDSGGKTFIDFVVHYEVFDEELSEMVLDHDIVFKQNVTGHDDGAFNTRFLTDVLPSSKKYEVQVQIKDKNGGASFSKNVIVDGEALPLEIVADDTGVSRWPLFRVKPIKSGQKYKLFFAADNLQKDGGGYSGLAAVILQKPIEVSGSGKLDESSISYEWDVGQIIPESDYPTFEESVSKFGDQYIGKFEITSDCPRQLFTGEYEVTIPKRAAGHYDLVVSFYERVEDGGIKGVGMARTHIQIE